jgi:hypothetical protein
VRPLLCVCALASFKPLEVHLCSLGLNYAPWGTFMAPRGQLCAPPYACAPPLCMCALASFKLLEAHICPLGAHLCPLGHFYAPWGSSVRLPQACAPPFPGMHAPPSQVCAPLPCVRAPLPGHTLPYGSYSRFP